MDMDDVPSRILSPAPSSQEELDHFADRAVATRAIENPVNHVPDLLGGIGWSERQAAALENNQVR